ncbi:hypothetical protein IQ270_24360 [Microcoleus sp. LEGE 07076]|uniref:hypothetical protein n=1 Tax=Microcoleus sp. LEGE 07076 TaxID=915322 RepID=UPI0018800913|nr:hypothetical protein [Microcoleus sp. LEGE 07076]MBE9187694.1 hypothetical protein [Microcoleus sp. LEGE 07076]
MGIGEWVTGNWKKSRRQQAGLNCQFHLAVLDPLPITNQLLPVINYQLTVSNR